MSSETARDTDTNESDDNDGWGYAFYSRIEISLRFRFAYLTGDTNWIDNPTDDDHIPDAVQHVLENYRHTCPSRHIENGNWGQIDDMLLHVDAPTANTENSSASSPQQSVH